MSSFLTAPVKRHHRLVGVTLGLAVLLVHFSALRGQSSVALRIIVVATQGEAEGILERLREGADFAQLAREDSIEPTARDGGYLGALDPAMLREELRDSLRSVAPGQFTGIVRIPSGYAIVKVLAPSEDPGAGNVGRLAMLSASATGAVYNSLNVGGLSEAESILLALPKADDWNQDLKGMCDLRRQSIPAALDSLRKMEGSAKGDQLVPERRIDAMQMQYAWGQLYAYQGDMRHAIERWEAARLIAESGIPDALPTMDETLGVAYLHQSELDNDVYEAPGERCLFPPLLRAALPETTSSRKAVHYFQHYLEYKPGDLEVKWLLNLAYMTLGGYPFSVPPAHLIPPQAFESKATIARFVDVAPKAGLAVKSLAGGAIVDDFDNDGQLDVVTSSMDLCEPLHYFHNNSNGTFTERTAQAGLSSQLGGLNLVQADYNNDGCMDMLVLRGGWEFPMRQSLLRNNCNGTFTDVTRESGLGAAVQTQTAAWADIDNDGLVDLLIGSENGPSRLFRNSGHGTFEDITEKANIHVTAFIKAVVAADYDNDGYMDFFLSNYEGGNLLLHNNGNGTFTEVGKEAGVQAPFRSFSAWFFDYDNDGWPDLFVNSYYISVDETMRTYLGRPHNAETLKLYKNVGNGRFHDVTREVGLDKVFMPMAANFGDVNNDGFLDVYLGMGSPSYASIVPHELLLNIGGKSFVSATAASGTGELHKGHGIAFADLDRDGDADIVAEIGGAVPGDRHALRLFENPGNQNDWLNVRLVGVKSNRAAIGGRVAVRVENSSAGGVKTTRVIHRTVSSGGSFGANPMELHIGLGAAATIQQIEVWWPATNTHQTFSNVAKNQFLRISEFDTTYTKLALKRTRLGGGER